MSIFLRYAFVSVLLQWIGFNSFAQTKTLNEKEISPVINNADKNQIRERIIYLSDDRLKGRLPGTEGYQMAVDFVINELKTLGVNPKEIRDICKT